MRLFPDFRFIVHKSVLIMLAFTTLVNIRRREDYQLAGACGSITPHATQRNLCCTRLYCTMYIHHSACTSTEQYMLCSSLYSWGQVITRVEVTFIQYWIIPYFLFTSSKLRFTFILNMITSFFDWWNLEQGLKILKLLQWAFIKLDSILMY